MEGHRGVQRGVQRGAWRDTEGCVEECRGAHGGAQRVVEGHRGVHGGVDNLRTLKVHHCLSIVTIGCP